MSASPRFGPPRLHRLCLLGRVPGGDQRPQPEEARKAGSTNNIRQKSIRHLACYARERIRLRRMLDPLEIQYLGGMVYLETVQGLR